MTTPSGTYSQRQQGFIGKAVRRLLNRRSVVTACEAIADRFRLITLEGPELKGLAWAPGHRVQILLGTVMARTYTPIEWDPVAGRTRILGYAHGNGPGSAWVQGVAPGDECYLFGPHPSVDISGLARPLAVLGDETAIGLAHALQRQDSARAATCYFEAHDVGNSREATRHLGMTDATLFARAQDSTHLADIEATLPALAAAGMAFVLAGHASSIQRLRQSLLGLAVPTSRIITRAYWASGKTGLK